MTDEELRKLIAVARKKAQVVGSLHAAWDAIFDAEAILADRQSILARPEVEEYLTKFCEQS